LILESLLQALVTGLLVGSLYGLMCAGLGIIFGVMRVINFAQGDFLMLGMYFALFASGALAAIGITGAGITPYLATIAAGPVFFLFGWLVHRLLLGRVSGSRAAASDDEGHSAQLILTLGVGLIITNLSLLIFGSSPQSIRTTLASTSWRLGPFTDDEILIFFNRARTIGAAVAILVAIALYVFTGRTRLGKAMRAAADNPDAATYMGIRVDRAHRIAFGIGTGATAIAGGLIATYYPVQPYIGFEFVIIMYAGVVLGGMGSILGAFWGGMAIGLVQQLATLVIPFQLQNAAIFIVFLLVVFFRPQGFFGRSVDRV
jgi:branched-chain amino acid transport system permease protein